MRHNRSLTLSLLSISLFTMTGEKGKRFLFRSIFYMRSFRFLLLIASLYIFVYALFSIASATGGIAGMRAFWLQQSFLFIPEQSSLWAFVPRVQSYWMFFTYSFIHVSLSHLFMNIVFLLVLGHIVLMRIDLVGFLIIYCAAIISGALFFSLGGAQTPMAGSSGAIYGLAGAVMYWNWADYSGTLRRYLLPIFDAVMMVVSNYAYFITSDGNIAWQAHLGGCVAGFIYAALQNRREKK